MEQCKKCRVEGTDDGHPVAEAVSQKEGLGQQIIIFRIGCRVIIIVRRTQCRGEVAAPFELRGLPQPYGCCPDQDHGEDCQDRFRTFTACFRPETHEQRQQQIKEKQRHDQVAFQKGDALTVKGAGNRIKSDAGSKRQNDSSCHEQKHDRSPDKGGNRACLKTTYLVKFLDQQHQSSEQSENTAPIDQRRQAFQKGTFQ